MRIFKIALIALLVASSVYAGDYIDRKPSAFTFKAIYDALYLKIDCSNDPLTGSLESGENITLIDGGSQPRFRSIMDAFAGFQQRSSADPVLYSQLSWGVNTGIGYVFIQSNNGGVGATTQPLQFWMDAVPVWTIETTGDLVAGTDGTGIYGIRTSSTEPLQFSTLQSVYAFKYIDGLGYDDTGLLFNVTSQAYEFTFLGSPQFAINILGNVSSNTASFNTVSGNTGVFSIVKSFTDSTTALKLQTASAYNLINFDTTNKRISISNTADGAIASSTAQPLDITTQDTTGLMCTRYSNTAVGGGSIGYRSAKGTEASSVAVNVDFQLFGCGVSGYHSGGAFSTGGSTAFWAMWAAEAFTSTAQGTYHGWGTTHIGTAGSAYRHLHMMLTPAGTLWLGNSDNTPVIGTDFVDGISKLHLDTGTATPVDMRLTNGTTSGRTATDGVTFGMTSQNTVEFKNYENTSMDFYTNDIHRARIDNSGNFSIFNNVTANTASFNTVTTSKLNTPYAQTLVVAKSGGDYTTITAALAAITDATTSKRYCIKVMPGIYSEAITCKDFVDIIGSGWWNTIIQQDNATIVTLDDNILLSNFTINLANSTAGKIMILSSAATLQNVSMERIHFTNTGDFSHTAIYLTNATSVTNLYFKDLYWNATASCYPLFDLTTTSITNCVLDNCYYTGGDRGVALTGKGNTAALCNLELRNCYFNGASYPAVLQVSANNKYAQITAYDTELLTGTIYLGSSAATRTAVYNAYGGSVASVTKPAEGGTETFNAYGSVVGGVLMNNLNGTAGSATASGDTYLSGKLEVDGASYLGANLYLNGTSSETFFGALISDYGGFLPYVDDGLHFAVGYSNDVGNTNLIICPSAYITYDYDHTALSANPTVFIHSLVNPDTDNTQWLSFTHDQTNGVIATGKGAITLNSATGIVSIPTTDRFQFRDSAIYAYSSADGWLNLVADTGVEVNAPILNVSDLYVAGAIDAPNLPTGTLVAPPAGLGSGDFWTDTTDSATDPIVRCHL